MLTTKTHRPRNVNAIRAAALLYGDWGTSKAYVIGLAFAIGGFASFWLILSVSILSIIIGLNYILICRYYPNGGGVYSSMRQRSEVLSMVGAFFIIADYFVTAALSALSAFSYLGVSHPIIWSACAIAGVALLNFFGPRHTGGLAFIIVICTFIVFVVLAGFSLPFLGTALERLQPVQTDFLQTWKNFVGVIVALSGVEAIANATGVMKLNRGTSEDNPLVTKTSTPAIVWVMLEVAIFTALFALAMLALNGLEISGGTVNAPGNPNVRDYMLRYMGEIFSSEFFGTNFGHIFGLIISIVIGILLLTAVNTAVNGLIAVLYLMSKDGEVPATFQKLNRFGVPFFPLIVAGVIPIILVVAVQNIAGLADLYAIGFAGAIAANLGSTSTNYELPLQKRERIFMFLSFLIMLAIEFTLFYDKPHARMYALSIITVGLILRSLTKESKDRKSAIALKEDQAPIYPEKYSLLCSVTYPDNSLEYAIQKARNLKCHLYILFIRQQNVISESDLVRSWDSDEDAKQLHHFLDNKVDDDLLHFLYTVSDSPADSIVNFATQYEVNQLIMGLPKQHTIFQILQGNIVRDITRIMPKHIHVLVVP